MEKLETCMMLLFMRKNGKSINCSNVTDPSCNPKSPQLPTKPVIDSKSNEELEVTLEETSKGVEGFLFSLEGTTEVTFGSLNDEKLEEENIKEKYHRFWEYEKKCNPEIRIEKI